jgi:hypothetical protein
MIQRLFVLLLLSIIVIGGSASFRPAQSANPEPCAQNHAAWLKQVSEKMETIKPGMTRWDLLKILRTEGTPRRTFRIGGGPPQVLRESFVSQDCPYLRIDVEFVEFEAGAVRNQDVVVRVSKPYLQFATTNLNQNHLPNV